MITPSSAEWRLQRINCEPRPVALIGRASYGDKLLVWGISETFAPILAQILRVELLA